MPKFQLLTAMVALGGDKNNIAFRGDDNPLTYPEVFILRSIHGGEDMVTDIVEIGEVERSHAEEKARLRDRYGAVVDAIYSGGDALANLPMRDDSIPTSEQVALSRQAAAEALANAKSGGKKSGGKKPNTKTPDPEPAPAPEPDPAPAPTPEVPSLDDLPAS